MEGMAGNMKRLLATGMKIKNAEARNQAKEVFYREEQTTNKRGLGGQDEDWTVTSGIGKVDLFPGELTEQQGWNNEEAGALLSSGGRCVLGKWKTSWRQTEEGAGTSPWGVTESCVEEMCFWILVGRWREWNQGA